MPANLCHSCEKVQIWPFWNKTNHEKNAQIESIIIVELIRYSNGNNTQALKQFLETEQHSTGVDPTKIVRIIKFVALRPHYILPPQVL